MRPSETVGVSKRAVGNQGNGAGVSQEEPLPAQHTFPTEAGVLGGVYNNTVAVEIADSMLWTCS